MERLRDNYFAKSVMEEEAALSYRWWCRAVKNKHSAVNRWLEFMEPICFYERVVESINCRLYWSCKLPVVCVCQKITKIGPRDKLLHKFKR